MKLDVVMPVHNRARYVAAALHSLLRQDIACDLDVVVVDDGSTDETVDIVRAVAEETGRVRLVRQDNRGVTAARNTGLRNLREDADLLSFLDSDDVACPGYLTDSVARLRDDDALDVTYGLMTLADVIDEERFAPAAESRTVTVRGVSLSAGVYRRAMFDGLGGFDETFEQSEDLDMLFRIFERAPKTHMSERVAMIYRRHSGNMTRDHAAQLKYMMRAIHHSLKRRKANPALVSCEGIFDLQALVEARRPGYGDL